MRERRYVKFRIDMYEDTKFKIIDRMPKRDLIHYVWNRIVVLAGKVNQEGDLYLSRSIPYTVETLGIEFNREIDEIKAALDILMELEMIELAENKVYRVKNFAKHQNIKVKEKVEIRKNEDEKKHTENNIQKYEVQVEDSLSEIMSRDHKNTISSNVANYDVVQPKENVITKLEDVNKKSNSSNKDSDKKNSDITQHNNIEVNCEKEKNKKRNKKTARKKNEEGIIETNVDVTDCIRGGTNDDLIGWFSEGDILLGEGERKIEEWVFS
ncbi:phage replisome organizer N-terminal domain-containing protein [Clostridium chromiireducens]